MYLRNMGSKKYQRMKGKLSLILRGRLLLEISCGILREFIIGGIVLEKKIILHVLIFKFLENLK